jgi:hypothetical protein
MQQYGFGIGKRFKNIYSLNNKQKKRITSFANTAVFSHEVETQVGGKTTRLWNYETITQDIERERKGQ